MKPLNRTNFPDAKTYPISVLQFGGGNFLRAFVDWMMHHLNEETDFNGGIAIIKPTHGGNYAQLRQQDGLFTVLLNGIKNGEPICETTLVRCVQDVVNPYTQWEDYLDLAKDPNVRFIVSNTTEAGIRFNGQDRFEDSPPKEFPAKLTLWLYHRFEHFEGDSNRGCILLPCELIVANGEALKKAILNYAEIWNLGKAFKDWIHTANYFYNTLVDRIVSGYPTNEIKVLEQELGYTDQLLVSGEMYHSWIIEGPGIIQKELPFKNTPFNVKFVKDLSPYRQMKVRILNGAHTAMVPVGYLAGIRLVHKAMGDPSVFRFVDSLLRLEVAPTLPFADLEKNQFIDDVLNRFENPALNHQLISISLNSTSKFMTRLYPTLADYMVLYGKLPQYIVFALSALLYLYRGLVGEEEIPLKDNLETLNFFKLRWQDFEEDRLDFPKLTTTLLGNTHIWGEDLTRIEGLEERVNKNIIAIHEKGMRLALYAFLEEVV